MQDIKKIIAEPDKFKNLVKLKNINLDIDNLISQYEKRKDLTAQIEELRKVRNENVAEIKKVNGKPPADLVEKGKVLKEKLSKIEHEFNEVDSVYMDMMWRTPQEVSPDTPEGKDENENVPGKSFGTKPEFDFEPKDHMMLAQQHDLIDFERGVKVHGFRGYFLKNELAAMHMGLMMYALTTMMKNGYTPMIAPAIVKERPFWNSGMFPFAMEDTYELKTGDVDETGTSVKDRQFLAGTAEVPLVSMHADEIFQKAELPKKYVGFSPCYRSEVGSYGKDTRGIYRIHEFMKIEQVVICEADYNVSDKLQQEMVGISHQILDGLKLHYRDLAICTGDMGAGKYKMFDIETWMPSRNGYGETHSASNLGDWQSRRANIKYIDDKGEKQYVHMLNNTALASPRILVAILENYQNADGSITVPEVLRDYVGKEIIG